MRVPFIAPSARRHGVSDEDILHAYWNPVRGFDLGDGMTMLEDGPVIIHAMRARARYLRWKKEGR